MFINVKKLLGIIFVSMSMSSSCVYAKFEAFVSDNVILINNDNLLSLAKESYVYADANNIVDDLPLFNNSFLLGYVNLKGDNDYYALYSNSKIVKFRSGENPILQTVLSLNSINDATIMAGELGVAREELETARTGLDTDFPPPSARIMHEDSFFYSGGYLGKEADYGMGCLNLNSLKHGDFDSNGDIDIIIGFDFNSLAIFSTAVNKIIFNFLVSSDDLIDSEFAEEVFGVAQKHDPQFLAHSGIDELLRAKFPAMKSFAKIYVDDFNNDSKKDILMWRKLYTSRLRIDPVLGFEKVADLFVHYSYIDGEYKLQATEQSDIKSWLDTNKLTWQQGFPSKSECKGKEGQLIPEMHDALLNDPDVLQ